MSATLKLVSVNIERAKHYDRLLPFLKRESADVVCMQEVRKPDIPLLEEALGGARCMYAPVHFHPSDGNPALVGSALFSKLSVEESVVSYYVGRADDIPETCINPDGSPKDQTTTMNCALVFATFEKGGAQFRIGTTHFTWSPRGEATEAQRKDMRALLAALTKEQNFVLTGDFNAPRGGEIFSMLAEQYRDNVPLSYTSSIDGTLHRAGRLELMVDGMFSTPGYAVSDVRMVSGVSDHCALVATVEKVAA